MNTNLFELAYLQLKSRLVELGVRAKTYTSDLTASQWQAIPKRIQVPGKSVHSLKLTVKTIYYQTKSGITWRDLSQGFPLWQTVYWYFQKWNHNDIWLLIASELPINARVMADKRSSPR
jgi:transposase